MGDVKYSKQEIKNATMAGVPPLRSGHRSVRGPAGGGKERVGVRGSGESRKK